MTDSSVSPASESNQAQTYAVSPGGDGLTLGKALLFMLGISAAWMGVLMGYNFLVVKLLGL